MYRRDNCITCAWVWIIAMSEGNTKFRTVDPTQTLHLARPTRYQKIRGKSIAKQRKGITEGLFHLIFPINHVQL